MWSFTGKVIKIGERKGCQKKMSDDTFDRTHLTEEVASVE
jgi:hypothetical protein